MLADADAGVEPAARHAALPSERAGDVSQVWRMLAMLSDSERVLVVLRVVVVVVVVVVVGLTVTDTSEMVGQNPGWVRYKQSRALATLRCLFAARD